MFSGHGKKKESHNYKPNMSGTLSYPHSSWGHPQGGSGEPNLSLYTPSQHSTKKAVLVGCNYIGSRMALKGAIPDAKNMFNFLTTYHHFSSQNIMMLTDDNKNNMPTKSNIVKACQWLVSGAKPGDTLFFMFSGHGGQTRDLDGDEADGLDELIYPCDYQRSGRILDDELHNVLVSKIIDGVRLIGLMDCCHSGTGMDLPYEVRAHGNKPSNYQQSQQQKRAKQKKSGKSGGKSSPGLTVCFSACEDNQQSGDLSFGGQNTGALTYAFVNTLKQHNGYVTYWDLLYEMRDWIRKKQTTIYSVPQITYNQQWFDPGRIFVL